MAGAAHRPGDGVVGYKVYGRDQRLYLEIIETGWTPTLESRLLLRRQALHCAEIDLTPAGERHVFRTALPDDLTEFAVHRMGEAAYSVVAKLQRSSC